MSRWRFRSRDTLAWDDSKQYVTRVDPTGRIEDVANAIGELIAEGKVLHFGLSEAGPETIRRAHAPQPLTAVQTEYSLMERDPERNGVLETCEELGIGFVPWGPVGIGYLTGKLDARSEFDQKTDLRAGFDRFSSENLAANQPMCRSPEAPRREKGRDTCADRAGMASGAEA